MRSLKARITCAFLLCLVGFVVSGLIARDNLAKISETKTWVEHTYQVLGELDVLYGQVKDFESAQRGYLINGDEEQIKFVDLLKRNIWEHFNKAKELTKDNPRQQQRLARLEPIVAQQIVKYERNIAARKAGGVNGATDIVKKEGLVRGRALREVIDEMRADELELLSRRSDESYQAIYNSERTSLIVMLLCIGGVGFIGVWIVLEISRSISKIQLAFKKVEEGDLAYRINLGTADELGALADAFDKKTERLQAVSIANDEEKWIRDIIARLATLLPGQRSIASAGRDLFAELAKSIELHQAALYWDDPTCPPDTLALATTYGCANADVVSTVQIGEGLVGQCARDRKLIRLDELPQDSFIVKTVLTKASASDVIIAPILFQDQLRAVVELASLGRFSPLHVRLIERFTEWIGVYFNSIEAALATDNLLLETQTLNEELQAGHEEMETQRDELERLNIELEERSDALEENNQAISDKNRELERIQLDLQVKAHELRQASKYKSEFLANMSHDLRTPLNSLMIFSELLKDNDGGNLTEEQVDFASNIHQAGKTLLTLIDDILDLSRIEAGQIPTDVNYVSLFEVTNDLKRTFEKACEQKGIEFKIEVDSELKKEKGFRTDEKRLLQLLKNLLGNAVKFTEKGSVRLSIRKVVSYNGSEEGDESLVAFVVQDTGIGIPADKHDLVFEAFQQADKSVKSKFGGTGLGLSICKEIARILGGYIKLESTPGQGSTFTCFLPQDGKVKQPLPPSKLAAPSAVDLRQADQITNERDLDLMMTSAVEDDRLALSPGDRVLLMIEDDPTFANMLLRIARKNDFKGVVALRGQEGLALARKVRPHAITLDLKLPDMDGWVLLDQLKTSSDTRHIPVHIISVEEQRVRGFAAGAFGYLSKPITLETLDDAFSSVRQYIQGASNAVLIVESDEKLRMAFLELLGGEVGAPVAARDGAEALKLLEEDRKWDCIVMDLNLSDMSGLELIETIQKKAKFLPIVAYAQHPLDAKEERALKELSRMGVVKGVDSPGRLLDEVTLFLHRIEESLPDQKREMLGKARGQDKYLVGRKILIVDDDPRNIAALTSLLAKYQMELLTANSGVSALQMLNQRTDIELVLMDIMMPEMDGYEAMAAIRAQERFEKLPLIAVTAKAMKGDRRKCIECGASDYISKPVDRQQLLSLMRVWLYKT